MDPAAAPGPTTPTESSGSSKILRVTINPSTSRIIQGAVYGVEAEVANISGTAVQLNTGSIELAVQPELVPGSDVCAVFYFARYDPNLIQPVTLQPGDRTTVFFNMGTRSEEPASPDETGIPSEEKANREAEFADYRACKTNWLGWLRKQFDFVPGNYTFVLSGTFTMFEPPSADPNVHPASNPPAKPIAHPQPNAKVQPPGNAAAGPSQQTPTTPGRIFRPVDHIIPPRVFTATATFPVAIDQSQIILYAALGGIFAWLVTVFRSSETLDQFVNEADKGRFGRWNRQLSVMQKVASAALVSVTVTVVASRLSTTQFPVKVSVDDFWGALTVGFVSYFIGGKFIDKLSDSVKPPADPTDSRR